MSKLDALAFRDKMPITRQWSYLDHAAVGPLTLPASEAVQQWCLEATEQGDTAWPRWHREIESCRKTAAEILNCNVGELALVPSTTAGINIVAEAFPWQSGDNIVTLDNEFPSNLFPWLNLASRGVSTRRVATDRGRIDLNRIAEACDDRTRLVAISWVGYASGWRVDPTAVAKVAHDHGAYLMLDAIQGVGVFPLDTQATDIDFLAADGHKWMLGPEGAGLFYCKQAHLELLRPVGVGWHSSSRPFDYSVKQFEPRSDAARFEGGTQNAVGFLALGASLRMLSDHGLTSASSPIADRVVELGDLAVEQLVAHGAQLVFDREPSSASGIVTFSLPDVEPAAIRTACMNAGIVVSCRGGGVRLSLHGYNEPNDVQKVIDVLAREF